MNNKINKSLLIIIEYFMVCCALVALLYNGFKFILKIIQCKIAESDEFYLNHLVLKPNSSVEEKISFHIEEMKELAQKISGEKDELQTCQTFNDEYLKTILNKCSTFRKQIQHVLVEEELKNQSRYEKMELTLLGLQDEMNLLRSDMENLIMDWKSPRSHIGQSLKCCYNRLSENAVQTEDNNNSSIPDPELEITAEVLLELKDCLSFIAEEYGREWTDQILKFYQSLKENYTDIKSIVYSCWKEVLNEMSNNANSLDKVQRVEQTVFGILIFLQQQSVEAQTVRETLKFFDHKFEKFLRISEARWNTSCSKLQQAFASVRKSQKFVKESSSDFSNNSEVVAQQLFYFDSLVKKFTGVARLIHEAESLSHTVEINVSHLTNSIHVMTNKIEGNYARKLCELQQALLKPGEKLYILYKTTEDLHAISSFFRSRPTPTIPSSELKTITEEDESKEHPVMVLNVGKEEQNTRISSMKNTVQKEISVFSENNVSSRNVLDQSSLESSDGIQSERKESKEKPVSFEQLLKDVSSDCLIQSSSNSSTSSEK